MPPPPAAAAPLVRRSSLPLPSFSLQVEIKAFLESVYGLDVAKVNTLNVEGKKKRGKFGFFRCGSDDEGGMAGPANVGWAVRRPAKPAACCRACRCTAAPHPAAAAACSRSGSPASLSRVCCSFCCRRPDYKKAFVVLNEPGKKA